jgi:hypothetical protein
VGTQATFMSFSCERLFMQQEQCSFQLKIHKQMKNQEIMGLIQGIEDLLSKNRCPLSNDDEALLKKCLEELRGIKGNTADSLSILEKVVQLLLHFFEAYNMLKDAF